MLFSVSFNVEALPESGNNRNILELRSGFFSSKQIILLILKIFSITYHNISSDNILATKGIFYNGTKESLT